MGRIGLVAAAATLTAGLVMTGTSQAQDKTVLLHAAGSLRG